MDPISLLHKYFPEDEARRIVLEHSRCVADKALQLARSHPDGLSLDLGFIEEAALLHDIGICRTSAPDIGCHGPHPYILHGILGREILEAEGLQRHALVCERHIGVGLTAADIAGQGLPLPHRDMTPITGEERIVCLADLFYSKKPGQLVTEKPVARVRQEIGRFGFDKTAIFDAWVAEFAGAV